MSAKYSCVYAYLLTMHVFVEIVFVLLARDVHPSGTDLVFGSKGVGGRMRSIHAFVCRVGQG